MSVFLKGKYYWFEFNFNGVRHRQTTKSTNEQIASRIEREYRRKLELGQVDLVDTRKQQKLFKVEVEKYIGLMQPHWKSKTQTMHNTSLPKVLAFFGKMVLTDITAKTIQEYQVHRSGQLTIKGTPPSNRTINSEITLVRQLLDHHKLWLRLKEGTKLRMLKENKDVGRALSEVEMQRLLEACRNSTSRSLYPAVLLSIFTGLRSFELKALRWNQIDFIKILLTVGKSKSLAGEGRIINLSEQAMELLKNWRSNFAAEPNHFVFPSEQYSNGVVNRTHPEKPYITFYTSWNTARRAAGVVCRWHDLRHSCTSILAEGGASDATLKAILGWMSPKMIERYSHSREMARKNAMLHLDSWISKTTQGESIQ